MNSPFQPGDKVVAYCRYSGGEEQGLKNTSTDEQEAAIRSFCDQNRLVLVRVYADPFVSGRSTKGREHYLEMMSDLLHAKRKKTDIVGLITWDFERLHRNMDQAQLDAARLRMAGYKIYSLQQPVMDQGPFSRVLEAMYFASAQNQSDMISADVKRALQNNFRKYKVLPSSCIGWGWIPEPVDMGFFSDGRKRIGYKAVPDPGRIRKIRDAVEARLRGASYTQCRQILGAPSNLDVKRLFRKIQLYGAFSYGGTVIEDYCEPMISKEKFDTLQAFEQSHPGRQVGRQGGWSPDPPMLSGLLYCAHCGAPMYITRRKSKGHLYCTYRCTNMCFPGVKQEILDPFIIEQCHQILTEKNIRAWIGEMSEADNTEAVESAVAVVEKDLAAVNKRIDTAVLILLDHPSEALTAKLSELETRKKDLESTLESLTTQRDSEDIDPAVLFRSAYDLSMRILSVLDSPDASASDRKSVLASFINSIVVGSDRRVTISYDPPGLKPKVGLQPDSVPPSINEKTGGVGSQSARNPKAPPEGMYSHAQQI